MIFPRRRQNRIACCLAICCALVIVINVYLLTLEKNDAAQKKHRANLETDGGKFTSSATSSTAWMFDMHGLLQDLRCNSSEVVPWSATSVWVESRQVYPACSKTLGCLLQRMATAKIIHATAGKGGTQMKLLLTLEGGQKVVFKPKRYPRDYIVQGTPYAGFDRHNGEIAAFHLNRMFDFRRGPIIVGRRISLSQEIIPVADKKLLSTFTSKDNQLCFYGVCYYCIPEHTACEEDSWMEGAVILWFPSKVTLTKPLRHPWARTYKDGVTAQWEVNSNYCQVVKKSSRYKSGPLLLDIIDTCIMDFLIGNADRHNFQIFQKLPVNMLILLDNGKSFGDPFHDENSILVPLEQCCILRQSTWEKVSYFANYTLGATLHTLLTSDRLTPVLTQEHLAALDRRIKKVLEVIRKCFHQNGKWSVLMAGQE